MLGGRLMFVLQVLTVMKRGDMLGHAGEQEDYEVTEPRADALVESLRAFGYSPATAIADLVDNSISAGAQSIDIHFLWRRGDSVVIVRDDGRGMAEAELVEAMRPGSMSPLEVRSETDLGRFGLGLKTASFSQARELTVATKQGDGAQVHVRRWDLDVIGETHQWRLLKNSPSTLAASDIEIPGQGTVVVWSKCDRLAGVSSGSGEAGAKRFYALASDVGEHLAMTFHRFMKGRGAIRLSVNGNVLEPWDPLMEGEGSSALGEETLPLAGASVAIRPFVLPHRSRLTPEQRDTHGGINGWNHMQGFYVYRDRRLMVAGSWLGLGMARDEHTKLARIAVDFPSELDHQWQIDVKKSSARPPGALVEDLRRIARATRRQAEEVYRHRGKLVTRRTAKDFVFAWQQMKTRDGYVYRVNREHPLVRQALENAGDRRAVERLLRFVEETVPTTQIGIGIADGLDQQPAPFLGKERELESLLRGLVEGTASLGGAPDVALEKFSVVEPFSSYPAVVQIVRESLT